MELYLQYTYPDWYMCMLISVNYVLVYTVLEISNLLVSKQITFEIPTYYIHYLGRSLEVEREQPKQQL